MKYREVKINDIFLSELYSIYNITIQDTPIHYKTTWLYVKTYEYESTNSKCEITTLTLFKANLFNT